MFAQHSARYLFTGISGNGGGGGGGGDNVLILYQGNNDAIGGMFPQRKRFYIGSFVAPYRAEGTKERNKGRVRKRVCFTIQRL